MTGLRIPFPLVVIGPEPGMAAYPPHISCRVESPIVASGAGRDKWNLHGTDLSGGDAPEPECISRLNDPSA